jgi:ligand-binding sensor domain-containing protein/two-component sensor histidine kinase
MPTRKGHRILIGILLFELFVACAQASTISYRQYTVKDGLIHSRVYRVLQDKQGYLWCSTDFGLSRFDGREFVNYPSEADFSGAALALGLGADGTIWFSTSLGDLYYLKGNRITCFAEPNKLLPGKIVQIRADNQDRIWLINEFGLTGYIKQYKYIAFDGLKNIHFILPLQGNTLFATDHGIYELTGENKIVPYSSFREPVYSLEADSDSNVFFGTEGSVYKTKTEAAPELIASLADKLRIILIRADKSGKLWLTTSSPSLFQVNNGRLQNFLPYLNLENTFVNDIFCDTAGNVFLGTYGKGLYSLGKLNLIKYTIGDGLVNNTISIVKEDALGNIYAGSFGGVSIFKNGRFHPWYPGSFKDDEVINDILFYDKDTWVVSPLAVYRFRSGDISRRMPGGLDIFDNGNNLLLGDYNGLRKSGYGANDFRPMPGYLPIQGNRINRIVRDEAGRLWFATRNGIVCRSINGKLDNYLPGNVINDICEHRGILWAATAQGLWYNYKGRWRHCSLGDNGSNYSVSALAPSAGGTLWIGTQRGLLYYDGEQVNFFKGNIDLMTEDISCIYEDRNRNLWIATETGLFRLSLSETPAAELPPSVMITGTARQGNQSLTHVLKLPYYKNRAQISFLAIDYAVPEDIMYEYSLVESGQRSVWSRTRNRSVEFLSLSPGSYTFMVRARRINSDKVSAVKTVSVIVHTPFWQKLWFLLSSAAALLGIIFYLVLNRIKSIQRRERQRAQRYSRLLQLKQQAIHSLISPHFVFNALSSVQHFINKSDKLSANRYISRFASLIRKTMDDSSRFTVRLRDEIERLELYLSLEKLRLGDKLSYTLFVDEHLQPANIIIPSMLIQPFVENAIWHGIMPKSTGGCVTISFYLHQDRLKVVIEDNGIGIEESRRVRMRSQHGSRGLDITSRRIRLLGKITQSSLLTNITQLTQDNEVKGTRVELELPLNNKYESLGKG